MTDSNVSGHRSAKVFNIKEVSSKYFPSIPLIFFLTIFCLVLGFEVFQFTDSEYDQKRFFQLLTFVVLSVVLLTDRRPNVYLTSAWSSFPRITRRALLLIAVLGAVSSYLAPLPKPAFQEWSLFGLLFIYTLYVQTQLGSYAIQKIVLILLAVAFSLYGWRFLAGAYIPSLANGMTIRGYELFVGFAHPRFLNQIQSWVLPLLPVLPVAFGGLVVRHYKWFLWIPGIVGWVLLFASSGRATLMAMAVAAIAIVVIFNRNSLPWLKTHFLFFICGLMIYLVLFQWTPWILSLEMNFPRVTERLANDGLMGRDRLWGLALQLVEAHPILGTGPQQYANYHNHAIAAHPHSAPLQWVSEWGMVSFITLCSVLGYGFYKWVVFCRRYFNSGYSQSGHLSANACETNEVLPVLLPGLTASLVAGATHSLVSGVIVMPFSQMLMCLIIGWVLSIYYESKQADRVANRSSVGQLKMISVLAALLFTLGYVSFPDIVNLRQTREAFLAQNPKQTILKPRFWNQGLIGWH